MDFNRNLIKKEFGLIIQLASQNMRIILNNRLEELNVDKISVSELIKLKNYTFRLLVTKINNRLVKKEERESTIILEGDEVLILHMISGG